MSRILTRKRVLWFFTILLAAILVTLAAWIAVAGPVTVYRVVRYGDTMIDEFKFYPFRRLRASESPFLFEENRSGLFVPSVVELDGRTQSELEDLLQSNDTIAFLIIKDDALVYERYYQGHSQSSLSQSFSMAKSFTSALVGMALDDGLIASVDQPVTGFIPELAEAGFEDVTVRHLLTMMSGSNYVENDNPFGIHVILNYTPNLEREILGFGMERTPGEHWRYKSGDNALLALILDRALGQMTITDYTQERLWAPLGMQYDGMWTLDHEGDGLEKTWCCLAATARDFAKLGRLYLNDGNWGGRQLLSPDWIRQSTQVGGVPETDWPDDFRAVGWRNYGYQWWLLSDEEGDYMASGKDGQYLYVNPSRNVIILRLGWSTGDLFTSQWISLFKHLAREVS
jgi:CubicO group peptidase (beta-lactamase class C family)